MNSYERVMTAMQLGQPDRVPVVEFAIDPGVRHAICPSAHETYELVDYLDLDNVGCGADFRRVEGNDESWIDEWGVRYEAGAEILAHPVEGAVKNRDDLLTYTPPDPDAPHRLGLLPRLVERYKGKRAVIFHHRAAFMWSCYVAGIENLLMAFADDAEFAEAVMEIVTQTNERIVRNAVRAGADIVTLADDYSANWGPMFSREDFERMILPRFKRVADAVHAEGALVIKHSDGNLWPILDLIVDAGPDAINPLEPVAGMDLARVKAEYGDRVCLVGNIDCGELLSRGSIEDVEAAVKQCIADAGAGGGFMLSSSNSIHSSVKPENYEAMVRAGQRFGQYNGAS